jgi:agmatine/peptidylarginine deiminase
MEGSNWMETLQLRININVIFPLPLPQGAAMTWTMPPETAPQERIWMSFPRARASYDETEADCEAAYRAWTAVAHAIAEFEPVSMIVGGN